MVLSVILSDYAETIRFSCLYNLHQRFRDFYKYFRHTRMVRHAFATLGVGFAFTKSIAIQATTSS